MDGRVWQYIQRESGIGSANTVLVAVSGGADSMALLHMMREVREREELTLVALHAHHGLRAEAADEDAALVRAVCRAWAIPFVEKQLRVKVYSKQHGVGVQQAARTLRYEFFAEAMVQLDGDVLMTAHHGDDEVETVMMKLVRGTTPLSRLGIASWQLFAGGHLVRPLLRETKQQIFAYCQEHKIPFREDESNTSLAYTRNRFRAHVMSVLQKENPHVHVHAHRFARWHEDDNDYLFAQAEQALADVMVAEADGYVEISKPLFRCVPRALQRRMIHLILSYLYKCEKASVSALHIEQVQSFLMMKATRAKSLHLRAGVALVSAYDVCTFRREKEPVISDYNVVLAIPGICETPLGSIEALHTPEMVSSCEENFCATFDRSALCEPLYIRNRRRGDVFVPLGMTGTKKISRLFIDCKIAPSRREKWPLLVDANDQILWVPGLRRSRLAPVDDTSKTVVTCVFQRFMQ